MDCIAIVAYKAANPSEASFRLGDRFKIWPYDDFWANSKNGFVPLNRIEINRKKFKTFHEINLYYLNYKKVRFFK